MTLGRWRIRSLMGLALLLASSASAQSPDTSLWVADGLVRAIVRSGNSIYIGGSFFAVGPPTGGGVPVSATTGSPLPAYPRVAGVVDAVLSDGAGGWYIGGNFSAVGGLPRSCLAHILADASVAPWAPDPNGTVRYLAVCGARLYAYGEFDSVGGQPRAHLAAVNAITGAAESWYPMVDNLLITSMAASGSAVYLAGGFTAVNGQPRNSIAALDTISGAPTSWDPSPDAAVSVLSIANGVLYAGGNFTTISGQTRNGLAAFDLASGALTGWDPHGSAPGIFAIAAGGKLVAVSGWFTSIGGKTRNEYAVLDASTGLSTDLDLGPNPPGYTCLATDGSTLFAGGWGIADAYDARSGAQLDWNPRPSNGVFSLAVDGGTVFVGGQFAALGAVARNGLAELDATTGAATSWDPHIQTIGQFGVRSLVVSGSTLYVAGAFADIGGQPRAGLASVDRTTGDATDWNPNPDRSVEALLADNGVLYVGGFFNQLGGESRKHIAAVDLASGNVTAWNPTVPGPDVSAFGADASTVYAGAGPGIVALDRSTGASDWSAPANGNVVSVALVADRIFLGGYFTTIAGQSRHGLASFQSGSGAIDPWDPMSNGQARALAAGDGLIIVGGDFDQIGGHPRAGLAAISQATASVLDWYPKIEGDLAPLPDASGYFVPNVYSLCLTGNSLYAGGPFSSVGGWPSVGIAELAFDLSPSSVGHPLRESPSLELSVSPNPARLSPTLRFALPTPGVVQLAVYDAAGRRVVKVLDRVRMSAGSHLVTFSTSGLPAGEYFARLEHESARVTRKVLLVR